MEKMIDFFTARSDSYDQHMLTNVEGCKEAYKKMAELVPRSCETLLDLGCGTGLELDEIFKLSPHIKVTGIDLTDAMLEKLRSKHPEKQIELICGNYFDVDFGIAAFDCAISFQTMHHFSHESKISLYKKVSDSLRIGGIYIECDYMAETQEDEDFYYSENRRIRKEMNIPENDLYHFDIPCTVSNQIEMLKSSHFTSAEAVFRKGSTTIIISRK